MIRWLVIAFAIFIACQSSHARTIQMEHVSVEVSGEGPAVILVPGLSTPRSVWAGIAPQLAKHRVYLVQVNGFGATRLKSGAVSSSEPTTVSVIRSWSSGNTRERSPAPDR